MRKFLLSHPQWVFLLFMTFTIGIVISFLMTFRVSGFGGEFIHRWGSTFVNTYVIVFPTVVIVNPAVRKATDKFLLYLARGEK